MAVPALNFDLVGDKSGRVSHNKGVPFHQMLPPNLLHPQLPVAHLVLETWAIVFSGQQRLQWDKWVQNLEELFLAIMALRVLFLLPPS